MTKIEYTVHMYNKLLVNIDKNTLYLKKEAKVIYLNINYLILTLTF